MPFNRSVDAPDDGKNDIDNTSPRPAKRQRSALPRSDSNVRHTGTPPLSHNEDVESSKENADSSGSD